MDSKKKQTINCTYYNYLYQRSISTFLHYRYFAGGFAAGLQFAIASDSACIGGCMYLCTDRTHQRDKEWRRR